MVRGAPLTMRGNVPCDTIFTESQEDATGIQWKRTQRFCISYTQAYSRCRDSGDTHDMLDASTTAHLPPSEGHERDLTPSELRVCRLDLGLTQAQLAAQLRVTANTVARWERGTLRMRDPERVRRSLSRMAAAASREVPESTSMQIARTTERSALRLVDGLYEVRHNLPLELDNFIGREQGCPAFGPIFVLARLCGSLICSAHSPAFAGFTSP